MPRVCRNYQHQDFSHLLTPQQEADVPVAEVQQSQVITPGKRRRDSLISNRKLRYILSPTGIIHDRDCPQTAQIPDDAFTMCEDFSNDKSICPLCYRKALVRKGLELDLRKRIDTVLWTLHHAGATDSNLHSLFITHNARIYQFEPKHIYLKINEDCWILRLVKRGCLLYHNNYLYLGGSQRLIETGFHLQSSKTLSFQNALATMCHYSWEQHAQAIDAKQKAQRQMVLGKRLVKVRNYRLVDQRSILFRYFQIAVPKGMPVTLPCRILKRGTYNSCELLLCRIPRWKARNIPTIADTVKMYCTKEERYDYRDFCLQRFSDKEITT